MFLSYEVEIDVLVQWFHLLFDRDASEQVDPARTFLMTSKMR